MNTPIPSFLADKRLSLLLFGGKGGVGKTSCAVAAALKLARAAPQSAFLLISTDPAHSLADCLAGLPPPLNLQVTELDAQQSLAAFKRQHGPKLYTIASRGTFLDHFDISRFLDLSLPGLDELMASLEIAGWVAAHRYKTIVVDTAPTGHTLRLLAMPALLKTWLGALDALLAKHRYMRKLYCGTVNHDQIDVFLEDLAGSVTQFEALLRESSRSRFVPVMLAEEMSLSETRSLLAELKRAQVPVTDIVVNRLVREDGCPLCADEHLEQSRVLTEVFSSRDLSSYMWWGVPLYPKEVCGAESLRAFWEGLTPLAKPPLSPETAIPPDGPWVERAALPPGRESLLLFAGKGGVGKTTLACATSVRLAQDSPSRQVLLCSTDPAHSLAHCLEVPIGPEPQRICPGLTGLEIDVQAEFHSLKQLYSDELRSFLRSLLPEMDLAFDREAMERIVDLSPPGLDEVMALTKVMDLSAQDHYRTLVLDCAPTGHLIRLLEMPELVDGWLRAFFGLFLKYEQIFRLPKVSQRLVEMSKALKRLRALLADPARCALYGVAILTDMAFEETKDLLAACQRMQVNAPLLFLNMATPPSDCPLCSARRRREFLVEQQFRLAFPAAAQVLVYQHGQPRGLARLGELGQAIYTAPATKALTYA
jgi:arsenite-transporting ATPase